MNDGNKIIGVRMPPALLHQIDAAITAANECRFEEPYDRAGWIRVAIREKLAKLQYGRKTRRKGGQKRG